MELSIVLLIFFILLGLIMRDAIRNRINKITLYNINKRNKRLSGNEGIVQEYSTQKHQLSTWKKPTGFILIIASIGVFVYSLIRSDSLESRYRQGFEDFIGYSDENDMLMFLSVGSVIVFIIGIVLMFVKSKTIVSQVPNPIIREQDALQASATIENRGLSAAEQLEKIFELKEKGVLTEEEFELEKQKLLK